MCTMRPRTMINVHKETTHNVWRQTMSPCTMFEGKQWVHTQCLMCTMKSTNNEKKERKKREKKEEKVRKKGRKKERKERTNEGRKEGKKVKNIRIKWQKK